MNGRQGAMAWTTCTMRMSGGPPDSDLELLEAFGPIGAGRGYDEVLVRYAPFKEFKSRWWFSGRGICFHISDYMRGSDKAVLGGLAAFLYDRVGRRPGGRMYPPALLSWLGSREFISNNQATYLRRSRNLSLDHRGEAHNLQDAYLSLRDQGLVREAPSAVLSWTISKNRRRIGHCSVLMEVIAVSSLLDSPHVPSFVPEYVLYHELLHLEDGIRPDGRHHGPGFREREREHPYWKESEKWLRRLVAKPA